MTVVEIRNESGLRDLEPEWNRLLASSGADTVFLTWEWITAWWSAYGNAGDLRILLARDEHGTLRGIAPLRHRVVRGHPMLSFLGDGSSDSDYLDFIIARGEERPVLEAFWRHWRDELGRGTMLELNEVPEASASLGIVRELAAQNGMLWSEADSPCGTVALPDEWQAYLKSLSSRFRSKVRSVLRGLESRADVQFRFCQEAAETESLLPALFDLHQQRWAREAKPGVFQWDRKRAFYHALSPLLLKQGWLCFSSLEWKGRVLACQYGFAYNNCYFQLQEGYAPDCEHWNVGIALRAWTIQEFLKRGLREYDFLGGVGRHKSDWGAQTKLSKRVLLGKKTAANVLFCKGPQWVTHVRQSVKRQLPERLIAARDAEQEKRRVATFERRESGLPAPAASWLRDAASTCYFRSPLPAMLHTLRDRYELRTAVGGRKMQLAKRREASARIFYFHRVNDDGDPFIGGLPIRVFEQQMKFIARHYHVVSLSEATRRLAERGPAEPVVAITFDDGYQDNYTNAFPVLQRYGLPATIFVTTGSVDSRERPWFEQLSLAVKSSSLASVDLEIDVPRRLWMRTETERLDTKNQIIAILRNLPDKERRGWIAEILAQLGVPEDDGNTMLTWDQIRLMKQGGIDFGGHTVTHPFVSRLQPEEAIWEASECKERIEQELQSPVELFAYPNGREGDFEAWNQKVLQDVGYRAAVSTIWGVNYPSTDPMALRRGQPWEEDAAVFAAKLEWYHWTGA